MNTGSIDLLLLGPEPPSDDWPLGRIFTCQPEPKALAAWMNGLSGLTQPEAWLFWDPSINLPSADTIRGLLTQTSDIWHAGLRLGLGGLPGALDFVAPTWMFNADAGSEIESTSWRVSLRSCLTRADVVQCLGFILPEYDSLTASGLEWGHRCQMRGAILRHTPELVPTQIKAWAESISLEDELRFIFHRYGRRWMGWAAARALLSRYAPPGSVIRAVRALKNASVQNYSRTLPRSNQVTVKTGNQNTRSSARGVAVVIPTVDRYSYLHTLLTQLGRQTRLPRQVIVVDQTQASLRQPQIRTEHPGLPLEWVELETAGQCTARNAGLARVQQELILFLDDDVEIPDNLIETLLTCLEKMDADSVSGVAHEVQSGPLPETSTFLRLADVFPMGITMVRRQTLRQSGLFDPVYDHGARADGDLGMRVYLSGARMILDPAAAVLHHRAPRGGLRIHRSRVITYAASRMRLTQRRLASSTEFYLARRYFTPRQVREMGWLNILGTFSIRGGPGRRIQKALLGLILLPDSLMKLRRSNRHASQMLLNRPPIPQINELTLDEKLEQVNHGG